MGALKGGLKATLCNLSTIVYNCALFLAFLGPFLRGNFRRKMMTIVGNRGHLWTSTLSPHLLRPHLAFPDSGYRALSLLYPWPPKTALSQQRCCARDGVSHFIRVSLGYRLQGVSQQIISNSLMGSFGGGGALQNFFRKFPRTLRKRSAEFPYPFLTQ